MEIDKGFFRQVMGHFATGVTVVTTSSQGVPGGLTVNAFCSVSLNPPLVLACVDLSSQTLPLIRESQVFAVNMLTNKQEHISRCFATRSTERFEHFCHAGYHTAATGAPILDDVLAFVDTRVVAEYPGGDHAIFLGQVVAMGTSERTVIVGEDDTEHQEETIITPGQANGKNPLEPQHPLLYYGGQYRHLASLYHHPSLTEQDQAYERKANS